MDFSNSSSAAVIVTVNTTANSHGGKTGGTTPDSYNITVNELQRAVGFNKALGNDKL